MQDDSAIRGGYTPKNVYFEANSAENVSRNIVKVTFDNLKNSSYNGKKLTKMVQVYHDAIKSPNNPYPPALLIWSNPFNGFWYWQIDSISVDYHLYFENGEELSIPSTGLDGKHSDAWITVGSLNSGAWRTEGAALESQGKAYGFSGSPVAVHNGNWLYAEYANEWRSDDNPWHYAANGNGVDPRAGGLPMNWDTGLDNPYAYIGAGVFNVSGKGYSIRFTTDHANGKNPAWTWATISTSIVKSSSGIVPPTVHYKDTEVVLELIFSS